MELSTLQEGAEAHVLNTYGARKLSFVRGDGTALWDSNGKEYLDFFSGIAVTCLGHNHPAVTEAIVRQAQTLIHTSNLYLIEPQLELAEILCANSFADKWFFCNSGAEANEAAIKIARRYWHQKGTPRPVIFTMKESFHGRTLTTVTATGQPKFHEGFGPLPPGFEYVEYGNIDALRSAMRPDVGAVMLEPIQGESGVRTPSDKFLAAVRQVCDELGALMILDEIQTGVGRTGKFFAYEHAGITPDIVTLAKGLANGVPIGAMGCTEDVATGFTPGTHGSTFGGNFLATAAAVATVNTILAPGMLEHIAAVGKQFIDGLKDLQKRSDRIVEVRGRGLMVGVRLSGPAAAVIANMIESGIVCGPAGGEVVRFLPPYIVTQADVDRVLRAFETALETV